MKRLLVLFGLLALTSACVVVRTSDSFRGSLTLTQRTFDLTGFTRIEGNTAAHIEVKRGETFECKIEVNDNLEAQLDVRKQGNTLVISMKDGQYTNLTLNAWVTMPRLTGVNLNGASRLSATLDGEDFHLDLNGASQTTLVGKAGKLNLVVNGASMAFLSDLEAGDVTLDVNGASHARVRSTGNVRGIVNGASTVTVSGSPTLVDVKAEGASRVIKQ